MDFPPDDIGQKCQVYQSGIYEKKKMGVIAAVKIKTYSVEIWNRFVIILNLLPHEFNTWWFPWKPVDIQLGTNNVPDI